MTNLPCFEEFLLSIKVNNYSPETLYNYQRDLMIFEGFLRNDLGVSFEKISKRSIELYKAYLLSRDRKTSSGSKTVKELSATSVNRALSSVRRFLKYLIEVDYPTPLPPEAIRLIKTPKKHPRVAELDALIKLIEYPTHHEHTKEVAL